MELTEEDSLPKVTANVQQALEILQKKALEGIRYHQEEAKKLLMKRSHCLSLFKDKINWLQPLCQKIALSTVLVLATW